MAKMEMPASPTQPAKASAWPRVSFPRGSGRREVRFIRRSFVTSYTWLSVLAAAAQQKVPADVQPALSQFTFSPLPAHAGPNPLSPHVIQLQSVISP